MITGCGPVVDQADTVALADASAAPVAPGIPDTVARLRATYATGRTRTLEWRKQQLKALETMMVENEAVPIPDREGAVPGAKGQMRLILSEKSDLAGARQSILDGGGSVGDVQEFDFGTVLDATDPAGTAFAVLVPPSITVTTIAGPSFATLAGSVNDGTPASSAP